MGKKIAKTEKPMKKVAKTKKFVIASTQGKSTTYVQVEAKDLDEAVTKANATGKLKSGSLSVLTVSEYNKLMKK